MGSDAALGLGLGLGNTSPDYRYLPASQMDTGSYLVFASHLGRATYMDPYLLGCNNWCRLDKVRKYHPLDIGHPMHSYTDTDSYYLPAGASKT